MDLQTISKAFKNIYKHKNLYTAAYNYMIPFQKHISEIEFMQNIKFLILVCLGDSEQFIFQSLPPVMLMIQLNTLLHREERGLSYS